MWKHTSQNINRKLLLIEVIFVIALLQCSMATKQASQPVGIECLLQQPIQQRCIGNLNVETILQMHPQSTVYACPLLVKFCEDTSTTNEQIWRKAQIICKHGTNINLDNGYTLLGLYLMKGQYLSASKLEYQLFFNQPFEHEAKFKQIMNKYHKYLDVESMKSKNPTNTQDESVNKAIKLFYLNQFNNSSKLIEQVSTQVKEKDTKQLLWMIEIRILEKQNQFPKALSFANNITLNKGGHPHWYFQHLKGNLLMHHLKFKQAIKSFEQSIYIKTSKQNERAFVFSLYNIGLCYQKTNDFQNSITYLRKAVAESPNSAQPLNSLAFSYYSLINKQQNANKSRKYSHAAENYYKQAIKADGTYYPTYHNYATLKFDMKDYAKAAQLFASSIKFNVHSPTASKYGLFKSLYKINKEKGMKYLNDEILINKNNSLGDIGLLFYQLGQNKIAKEYLERAITTNYNLGEVYEWKGIIQFEMDLYDEAAISFKKALEKGNTKPSIWFNLGYIQQLKQNYDKAMGLYKKSLEKDQNGPARDRIDELKPMIQKKGNKKQKPSEQQL